MEKEEIKTWLKNNSEKSEEEIEKFLFSEMNSVEFKESWHKHYLLEDLKSSDNGFSKKVLKVIDDVQKEINGVPMSKRYFAFGVDFLVWGLLCSVLSIFSIDSASALGAILVFLIYFIYVSFSIFKYKTTLGLYLFKIKIEFENNKSLILKIIAREILFFTVGTGIGFIIYLIKGPYWDRITGAHAVWLKR